MIDRLRERFGLDDYIRVVDFIDMGYGVQTPFPPQRPDVSERVIRPRLRRERSPEDGKRKIEPHAAKGRACA